MRDDKSGRRDGDDSGARAPSGLTRRDFARMAALLAGGAALPFTNESAMAYQGLSAVRDLPADAVLLNANENPMGPCAEAAEAVRKILPQGGRYCYRETNRLAATLANVEGLKPRQVLPFAGSSDPLHRAVLAFTSPTKSLVVADPGYEAAERAARFLDAKVHRVPLRADGSHDVKAMAGADPDAGLIYVCNPNNPTGSVTKKADVDYIIENKPKNSIVLLDEAYIHLSDSAVPGTDHVVAEKDVIILRTFSKLYGMAGLRAGAAFARPDLLESLRSHGAGALPITGVAAAIASLGVKDLVETRRRANASVREDVCSWLAGKGFSVLPTEANMFMVDVRRPGPSVFEGLLKEKVVIGRSWPSMPNHVRVTVGLPDEMAKFKAAFAKVLGC